MAGALPRPGMRRHRGTCGRGREPGTEKAGGASGPGRLLGIIRVFRGRGHHGSIGAVDRLAIDPGGLDLQAVQLGGRDCQRVAVQDHEIGAQARCQAADLGLVVGGIGRPEGEAAQGLAGGELLLGQPAAGRMALAVGAVGWSAYKGAARRVQAKKRSLTLS